MRTFILICFAMSFSMKAQTQIEATPRENLRYKTNTRVLYTTLNNVDAFEAQHPQWPLSLKTILTKHLHTSIVFGQKENVLQAYDGSQFLLEAELSALNLTEIVIQKIGGMYFGRNEVQKLNQKKKEK